MTTTLDRVPPHLRGFVVRQDYAQYNEMDQSVWRFVVLQLTQHLNRVAHSAYRDGFLQTGMTLDRIPVIDHMDAQLSRFGWGAVCVDGFLPPRAFKQFQAVGILPINADIRTAAHLAYTPAPDIIHETAGHAPILPNADYGRFLRHISHVGAKAFGSQQDDAIFNAIYRLSELKESPSATPIEVEEAEHSLHVALQAKRSVSEADRLSRLYWWTVEYGLIGRLDDYQLYGAGLLSSLGEGFRCRDQRVRKFALSADCAEIGYDITREQPQLFIARDFEHLEETVDQVASSLSYRRGGLAALQVAAASGEIGTVEFDASVTLVARITEMHQVGVRLAWISADPPWHVVLDASTDPSSPSSPSASSETHRCIAVIGKVGTMEDDRHIKQLKGDEFIDDKDRSAEVAIRLAEGVRLVGHLVQWHHRRDGVLSAVTLDRARMLQGETSLTAWRGDRVSVLFVEEVRSAFAGTELAGFWPESEFSHISVPKPRAFRPDQQALIGLYDRAKGVGRMPDAPARREALCALVQVLDRNEPDEWLLRWRLLQLLSAAPRPTPDPMTAQLYEQLVRLEEFFHREQPIATGLRSLGYPVPNFEGERRSSAVR